MDENEEKDEGLENNGNEEKTKINSVLEGKKSEDLDQMPSLEFNNCIIISGDGGDINTIFQSGTVQGNIVQGRNYQREVCSEQKKDDSFYNFYRKDEIIRFIEDYRYEEEFLSFVSVAFLECIPDFLWIDITRKLIEALEDEKAEEKSNTKNDFMALDKKLELMHMISIEGKCRTRFGEVRSICMIFFEQKVRENAETVLWEQDYFLRKKILRWLLNLKNDENIGRIMGYQIVNALSRISVRNWSFFQKEVFEPMYLERGNSNRDYLVKILSYLLKNSLYNESLDYSIQKWIAEKNKFLWEIAYRLYGVNQEYLFQRNVETQLKKYFVQDLNWRCMGNGIYRAKRNAYVDLYPAYFNTELRSMLLSTLVSIYRSCSAYSQKALFSDYFIWLLTCDYKMEGYPTYKLIFLDALNLKETRLLSREMYWEMWEIYKVRTVWVQILQNHFMELEHHKKSWDYAKRFFEVVAFTGNSRDYETVQNCLYNMRDSKKTASQIGDYLEKILQRRRG